MDAVTSPQQSCCGTSTAAQQSCCGTSRASTQPEHAKALDVDYLYLDLTTCTRCQATDSATKEALAVLSDVFGTLGYDARLNEVNITSRELAEQYRFLSSPTIRVNGVDIETTLKESDCADCGSLSGCSTDCRVFTYDGQDYEQPPTAMIVDGILRVLYGGKQPDTTPYVLPSNLEQFFSGVETKQAKGTKMSTIHVYEPAMCCNTGVCGPDPAQELVQFTSDLAALKGLGADITRHNLANDALAFTQAEPVRAFMQAAGSAGLPLTTVDGAVVLTGRYPSRDELARYAGLADAPTAEAGCCGGQADAADSSCCGGKDKTTDSCGCGSGDQAESSCCGSKAAEPVAVAASSGCGCGSSGC
ncbi:MAG: arsenite efflux transporter metallochaperone ArsD [Propionibacteriaceae bacterium]|nr:arsenite efflux transporter metallochaperone ArsD [Propionibacteriaceae bacterium]